MNDTLLRKAGIDVEELLERLMNNERLVTLFVGKFINDKTYTDLLSAFEQGDPERCEFTSHTLKGMSGNLSIKPLYELFTRQVNLIRGADMQGALELMPRIKEQYEFTVSVLKEWLEAAI